MNELNLLNYMEQLSDNWAHLLTIGQFYVLGVGIFLGWIIQREKPLRSIADKIVLVVGFAFFAFANIIALYRTYKGQNALLQDVKAILTGTKESKIGNFLGDYSPWDGYVHVPAMAIISSLVIWLLIRMPVAGSSR